MSNFKIGDKVAYYNDGYRVVREIKYVDDRDNTLQFNSNGWTHQKQCRKIKTKPKLKFKIGDRVWGLHPVVKKFLKATITNYNGTYNKKDYPFEIRFDTRSNDEWYCNELEIKKIKMVKKKKIDLNIGDKVEFEHSINLCGVDFNNKKTGIIFDITNIPNFGNKDMYGIVVENRACTYFVAKDDCRKVS